MSIPAIYESYVAFCIRVGHLSPPTIERWLAMTETYWIWGR